MCSLLNPSDTGFWQRLIDWPRGFDEGLFGNESVPYTLHVKAATFIPRSPAILNPKHPIAKPSRFTERQEASHTKGLHKNTVEGIGFKALDCRALKGFRPLWVGHLSRSSTPSSCFTNMPIRTISGYVSKSTKGNITFSQKSDCKLNS